MIQQDRLVSFLHSMEAPLSPEMDELERKAIAEGVPIIRHEMLSFLQVLIELKKPKKILEVGTAVGFSALHMASCCAPDCTITTIEKFEKRIDEAKANFARLDKEHKITLLEGDALEIMAGLEGPYDMIFMDAAKGQYINFLPDSLRLLTPGGLLVSDNVLQDGDLVESHYAVERRNRTIYHRMREYLYTLKHTEGLTTSIVPIGDGTALSIKE